MTWLLAGRGGERGGGRGGNNCAIFPFFFFFLPLFSSPACLKLHTEAWLKWKRQREQDSHPLAFRTHPPARARLSRDIRHRCSNLYPASTQQPSALCPSQPHPISSTFSSVLRLVSWSQRSGEVFELSSHFDSSTAVHRWPFPGVCPTRHPFLQVPFLAKCGSLSTALEETKDPPKGWCETNFTEDISPGFLQQGYK